MTITPLMQHQQAALDYLMDNNPCALFMKQGTGKSLVALAYADRIKARRVLITSDKTNSVYSWPEQIVTHTDFKYLIRPDSLESILDQVDVPVLCVLVNYEYVARSKWLHDVPFDLWIGDESSEFKDARTDKHRSLHDIVKRIPRKVILNGSPITERAEDMWGQFKMLDGGAALGTSLTKFRQRYMQLDHFGYKWNLKRSAMTQIQKAVQHCSYWHTGEGVAMPTRKYHVATVPMTPEQQRVDTELKRDFEAEFEGDRMELQHAAVVFIKRIQLCGGIYRATDSHPIPTDKLGVLEHLVEMNEDKKLVIWHEYIGETLLLRNAVQDLGVRHWVYESSECTDALSQFQKAESGVLLIRNSFCKGLNALADGDIAIVWSNPLSYRDRTQLLGRTCRMSSKTRETHVVDLITKGGADEVVYAMLSQKKSFALTASNLRRIVDHR